MINEGTLYGYSGNATDFSKKNPVLPLGCVGYELDTNKLKIGNSVTPWNSLAYLFDPSKLDGIASGANVGVVPNAGITGAVKTKITYDAKGLVTAGADATTADVADSADKRYCTDAQKAALHAAVSVSAPISLSGQALSIVNDAAATITEVDTGELGNVDTTIPTSKVVTTAIAAHAPIKTAVHGLLGSVRVKTQVSPDALGTGAVTITIANMLKGIVTGAPNAARAYTLPTGTNCENGVTMVADESFDWVLINTDTTAADIITLTANTGHTIVGSVKVPSNSTTTGGLWGTAGATFRTRKTALNTFVTYRIG